MNANTRGKALSAALTLCLGLGGCAAAAGAVMAAGEIRRGVAGLQQLISSTREVPETGVVLPEAADAPIAGTYRGSQALGADTARFYLRTARQPMTAIVDSAGEVTGYALAAIAGATLDTVEARVRARSDLRSEGVRGRAIFFIEGTHPPNMTGRTLYPAAFLGRLERGESPAADRQATDLREMGIDMEAPEFEELEGQAIPHELFGSVAEGIFTVRAGGAAEYEQEYELDDGRTLVLRFERISETTLP